MVDKILNILNTYKNIDYKLIEQKKFRIENYFIKKSREMDRLVNTKHFHLTIYLEFEEDGEKYLGSASSRIHPDMNEQEIRNCIDEAITAAGFVKNKFYPLLSENMKPKGKIETNLADMDLNLAMQKLQEAFYSKDNRQNGFINYSEFYIIKVNCRIITSKGVDVSFTDYKVFIETAATWNENNKEVEFYEEYSLNECDTALIGERVEKLFDYVAQKTTASNMPEISNMNVLLSGECLKRFFKYFHTNSDAENIYNKQSLFKIGESVQGEIFGDRISMMLNPFLKGSTLTSIYDNDGFALDKHEIIKNGVLQKYWGSIKSSYYIDIEPTGVISNFEISGGTYSVDELREGKYLELVSFSDFHVDTVTGDFGSEIRLGFYCDGQNRIAVTGGSVSGNIKNVLGNIKMSKESTQFNNFVGPATICINNVNIAGV